MKNKIYTFKNAITGERFEVCCDVKGAEALKNCLCSNDLSDSWTYASSTFNMIRYNEIVSSESYRDSVEKLKSKHSGKEFTEAINMYHKKLLLRVLENRELFERFRL